MNYGTASEMGAIKAVPPKQPMIAEHAQKLHELASQFTDLNGRLGSALDRMSGAESTATGDANKNPSPSGVLYVAQFGAERIAIELDRMRSMVGRLENFA